MLRPSTRSSSSGDDLEVGLAGEATLLGRRTQIVELRPSTSGVVRVFVDPERMFILRWAVDGTGGGQSYRAEVTALDYDTKIDASRFTFDPPPGAREAEATSVQSCSSASGPIGGASFPAEPGFLRLAYTSARYHSTGAGSEGSANGGCGPIAVWALLEAPDGAYILLRQRLRPGGVPRVVRSWQPVDSNLDEAYRHSEDGVLASSGVTGTSSPSSKRTLSRSRNCCASPSHPALSRPHLDERVPHGRCTDAPLKRAADRFKLSSRFKGSQTQFRFAAAM